MLSTFVAEATHHVELPVPPFVYGIAALLIFTIMLCALFSFRQAATKVPGKDNTVPHGQEHGGDHDAAGDHR